MSYPTTEFYVEDLSCERGERVLFSRLSFKLTAGDIFLVQGPNGVGKTSLLRILAGLLQPTSGRICWAEQAIGQDVFYRNNILFISHLLGLKLQLSPRENLSFYESLEAKPVKQSVAAALEVMRLTAFSEEPLLALSAGQQRRTALARLHLLDRPIWILDEPFTALDASSSDDLQAMITNHSRLGGLVILTSHQDLPFHQEVIKTLQLGDFQ